MQGGDTQDQNLLQFFLNIVEFGMNVQQAAEAANINSYQMQQLVRRARVAARAGSWSTSGAAVGARELRAWATRCDVRPRTSGPINAIFFDREHGTMWGGSSDYGEDYGIAW